jgi:SAM-dependent methyltransferase
MNKNDLDAWFNNVQHVLENAYLAQSEPWRQSGMSGPEERWVSLRRPIANCIDRDGMFLDIGCANGYLLECCLGWTAERGIHIDPYGLDVSPGLVALARQRLVPFAEQLFSGNAFYWDPPRKFDFVRTELVYVPAELEREYILRLGARFLTPQGKLLVANYMEDHPNPEKGLLPGSFPTRNILDRLAELGFQTAGYEDGFDPLSGRKVRIAILDRSSISTASARDEAG